jgi:hypothetical protein
MSEPDMEGREKGKVYIYVQLSLKLLNMSCVTCKTRRDAPRTGRTVPYVRMIEPESDK